METKSQGILPGDRPTFIAEIPNRKKKNYQKTDLEGFVQDADTNTYATESDAANEEETGLSGKAYTREEAIQAIAKNEGIQNPSGDLEQLLEQIKAKKKKKTEQYDRGIDRPGI